jgi:hypothetical protein
VSGQSTPPPQTPFSQTSLQHSLGTLHASPSGSHGSAQAPPASHVPLQHAPAPPHAEPFGRQATHAP